MNLPAGALLVFDGLINCGEHSTCIGLRVKVVDGGAVCAFEQHHRELLDDAFTLELQLQLALHGFDGGSDAGVVTRRVNDDDILKSKALLSQEMQRSCHNLRLSTKGGDERGFLSHGDLN